MKFCYCSLAGTKACEKCNNRPQKDSIHITETRVVPSVNVVERKRGEWLRKDGRVWSECSVCGSGSSFETKFCGNCGADMRGEE